MVIETERLILRPFAEGDAADVYEYLKEPAVNCFADMKLHSPEEAKEEMKRRLGEDEYYLAIPLKDSGKVIGEIEAYPEAGQPHPGENDPVDTVSPCWMLNDRYQGQGYATAALQELVRLAEKLGKKALRLDAIGTNKPAQKLYEKFGFANCGTEQLYYESTGLTKFVFYELRLA